MILNVVLVIAASSLLIACAVTALKGHLREVLTDPSSQLVLATFAYSILPSAIDQFVTRRRLYDDVRGAYLPLSSTGSAAQSVFLFVLVATLFFTFVRMISSREKLSLAGAFLTLSVLTVLVATISQGATPGLGLILLLAVCAAAACVRPTEIIPLSLQLCTSSLLLVSALATIVDPNITFVPCRIDKCNEIGEFYSGLWTNPNGFALLIALSGVWFFANRSKLQRLLSGASIAVLLVAAGSRTAQVAAVIGVVIYIVAGRTNPARIRFAGALTMCVWIVSLVPSFVVFDDSQFTQRGLLWSAARLGIASHPFGQGADAWRDLYELYNSIISSGTYSAHNEILDVAFRGGILAAIALLAMVVTLVLRFSASRPDLGRMGLTALALAGALSLLERPWGMNSIDWLTCTLIALVMFSERVHESPEHIRHRRRLPEARTT